MGKRRVVEGQNENIQSKKIIILMLMRNVTGLCVIHSFNYGVIASRFIACYATSIRQGKRGWWRVDPHQHFLGGLPSSGSAAHQDSLEGKHSWSVAEVVCSTTLRLPGEFNSSAHISTFPRHRKRFKPELCIDLLT